MPAFAGMTTAGVQIHRRVSDEKHQAATEWRLLFFVVTRGWCGQGKLAEKSKAPPLKGRAGT
jgi:hypothetical protein